MMLDTEAAMSLVVILCAKASTVGEESDTVVTDEDDGGVECDPMTTVNTSGASHRSQRDPHNRIRVVSCLGSGGPKEPHDLSLGSSTFSL
jgi:hypothetical protein